MDDYWCVDNRIGAGPEAKPFLTGVLGRARPGRGTHVVGHDIASVERTLDEMYESKQQLRKAGTQATGYSSIVDLSSQLSRSPGKKIQKTHA
jgi:hypothetical protein